LIVEIFIENMHLFELQGKKNLWNRKLIPEQLKPFPEYPILHAQLKLPIAFVQIALELHPPLFVEHSLISIINSIN